MLLDELYKVWNKKEQKVLAPPSQAQLDTYSAIVGWADQSNLKRLQSLVTDGVMELMLNIPKLFVSALFQISKSQISLTLTQEAMIKVLAIRSSLWPELDIKIKVDDNARMNDLRNPLGGWDY